MKFNKNITLDFFNFLNQKKGVRAPYYVKRALGVPLEPEDNVLDGDLKLSPYDRKEKLNIPDGMVVNGDFFYRRLMSVDSLPKNFTVNGEFGVSDNSPIDTLPKNLTVNGGFSIPLNVKRIEDDVVLKGYVRVFDPNKLQKLPNNLNVQKLSIHHSPNLHHLPKNLRIETDCYISKTSITHVPDNTFIGGNFNIDNSPVASIGNGVKVKKSLFFQSTVNLEKIGTGVEIQYFDLTKTNVNETNFRDIIPKDIKAGGIWMTPKNREKILDDKGRYYITDYGLELLKDLAGEYTYLKFTNISFL